MNLINGDGALHDIAFPQFGADSDDISGKGTSTAIVFRANDDGSFEYLCTLPGHKAAGMVGRIIVGAPAAAETATAADVSQDPNAVGTPARERAARHVTLDLETTEIVGQLADGTTYTYWTFNDKVPGPFVRVRVGDTVTVHSVDFHAVTGPGGGAAVTQATPARPGASRSRL